MPIYWTAKGLSDFQTPLRPPMDIQKSLKLHICILWSQVVTLKATTGLSLISFIYGTPPKSAPARKCWQNPDLLGDLWPRRKEFTKLKLCQIVDRVWQNASDFVHVFITQANCSDDWYKNLNIFGGSREGGGCRLQNAPLRPLRP